MNPSEREMVGPTARRNILLHNATGKLGIPVTRHIRCGRIPPAEMRATDRVGGEAIEAAAGVVQGYQAGAVAGDEDGVGDDVTGMELRAAR